MLREDQLKDSNNQLQVSQGTQNVVLAVYILQLLSLFTVGSFLLIPLIICYIFRRQSLGTWLDSHFRWQIQTFWFAIVFYGIGALFGFIPFLGWLISIPAFLMGTLIIVFRSIKGLRKLNSKRPPQNDESYTLS